MKAIKHILISVLLTVICVNSKAQLANGSIAPDFTLTDIYGNTHHLYNYLTQGKTVILDFSATWCGPCWNYHNTGELDLLLSEHGFPGTSNDIVVLLIESDISTTSDDLNGTGANTMGDWVSSTTYPICDVTNNSVLNAYKIAYYPTLYMICPDKICTQLGYLTAEEIYTMKQNQCFTANAANDAGIIRSNLLNIDLLSSCDSITPTFKLCNYGTSPLTSATIVMEVNGLTQKTLNWTGNIATYDNQQLTIGKVGSVAGAHLVEVKVSLPNGISDPNQLNNIDSIPFVISHPSSSILPIENFDNAFPPAGWIAGNPFVPYTDTYGPFVWEQASTGYLSPKSVFLNTLSYHYEDSKAELYLPAINTIGQNNLSMTFDVAYANWVNGSSTSNATLKVLVSTNCGQSWTTVYNKKSNLSTASPENNFVPSSASDWRQETVTLNSFINKADVQIKFVGISNTYANNLYIDNVNINGVTGTNENTIELNDVEIYPNPTNGEVNINLSVNANNLQINLLNMMGQVIHSENISASGRREETYKLDFSNQPKGIYFLQVITDNKNSCQKIVLK